MRAVPDCAVLYPCDAVSTERLVVEMAKYHGLAYMRTSRPKTPTSSTASTSSSRSAARRCCARARPTWRRSSAPASRCSKRSRPTCSSRAEHPHPRDRCLLGAADRRGDAHRRRQGDQRRDHHGRGSLPRRRPRRRRERSRRVRPAGGPPDRGARAAAQRPARRAARPLRHLRQAHRRRGRNRPEADRACSRLAAGAAALATVALTLRGARRRRHAGARDPAWSPDGQRLAFSYLDRIWTLGADGRSGKPLAARDDRRRARPGVVARRQVDRLRRRRRPGLRPRRAPRERRRATAPDDARRRRALAVLDA